MDFNMMVGCSLYSLFGVRQGAVVLIFIAFCAHAQPRDSCLAKIPGSLVLKISEEFPGYRLPRDSDQSQADRLYDRSTGGDGCFSVAIGDLTGQGKRDVAVLLAAKRRANVSLVVATQRGRSWRLFNLPSWCSVMSRCYVRVVGPGKYTRDGVVPPDPSNPMDRAVIQSSHNGVGSGALEATEVVYFLSSGRWSYVWVSS